MVCFKSTDMEGLLPNDAQKFNKKIFKSPDTLISLLDDRGFDLNEVDKKGFDREVKGPSTYFTLVDRKTAMRESLYIGPYPTGATFLARNDSKMNV